MTTALPLLNLSVVTRIPNGRWAALLVIGLGLLGCDADPVQGDLVPCRCDVEQCSSAACGYELRLDAACASQVRRAEILIDGHLETDQLVPGGAAFPCTKTEPGVESQIIIRGGDWVWGPLLERCLEPGDTRLLVLQCVEASGL